LKVVCENSVMATKPYHEMTPAERLAARIAKNREIDQRVTTKIIEKKPADIVSRQTAVRGVLDKFQQIKNTQGIDAASEYVRSRIQK
jgi:hypothetical protein